MLCNTMHLIGLFNSSRQILSSLAKFVNLNYSTCISTRPLMTANCISSQCNGSVYTASAHLKPFLPNVNPMLGRQREGTGLLQVCKNSLMNLQIVRGKKRVHYRGRAILRINKHGIQKRVRSRSGVEILWRRFLRGRNDWCPFQEMSFMEEGRFNLIQPSRFDVNAKGFRKKTMKLY